MKGYRTIIFNAVMLAGGIAAAYGIDLPEGTGEEVTGAIITLMGIGNLILRKLTTTPIGKKE